MEGREVRRILLENRINLAELAEKLGISPQGLNSRLNAKEFKNSYLIEIVQILHQDLFGIGTDKMENRQPIYDIRVCAGNGTGLYDDERNKILEYVSIPALSGCVGLTVYGESMYPLYKPGEIVFVRQVINKQDIDFGRTYLVVTHEDRLLKQIYESPKGDGYLRLCSYNISTNPNGEREYPDRDIYVDGNIVEIWKVVGSLNREQI